jgi:hypothetical protein
MWKVDLGEFLVHALAKREVQQGQTGQAHEGDNTLNELEIEDEPSFSAEFGRHALYGLRLPLNFDKVFDLNCVGKPIILAGDDRGTIDIEGFWTLSDIGFSIMDLPEYLEHEFVIRSLGDDLTVRLNELGIFLDIARTVIQTSYPISGKEVVLHITRLIKAIERCKSQELKRAIRDSRNVVKLKIEET